MIKSKTSGASTAIRALTADELDAVNGGMKNNPFRSAIAWMLIERGEKWLASIGVDTMGGYGQK
jgi:hypothetical protein